MARALGPRLWGVRLDTSRQLVDRSLWEEMGDFDPRGVNERLVPKVREALDRDGFEHVRIVVSGGFDVEKIARFERAEVPVDAYGVGSSLIRGENDFTADIVMTDGRESRRSDAAFGRARSTVERRARPRGVRRGAALVERGAAAESAQIVTNRRACFRESWIRSPRVAGGLSPTQGGAQGLRPARSQFVGSPLRGLRGGRAIGPGQLSIGSVERTTCAPAAAKRANAASASSVKSTVPGTTTEDVQSSRR